MADERERRIRERAYRLWEEQGRPVGRERDHWLQASREVGEELFPEGGAQGAQERPGALDGGLLPEGGLVAGGGPSGSGLGGLGMTGEEPEAPAKRPRAKRAAGNGGGSGGTSPGLGAGGEPVGTPVRKRSPRKTAT